MEALPVDFYLTGGTVLSRWYLNHRYSDDLDFFINNADNFKYQVEMVIKELTNQKIYLQVSVTDISFARIFINDNNNNLKIDFVNDVPFREGTPMHTGLYKKTDTIENILSNKVTALGRYAAKDVVDLIFISLNYPFNWRKIFSDASEKDMWVNPIEVSKILDEFPIQKLTEINWIDNPPDNKWFEEKRKQIISDIIEGKTNSLYTKT